MIVVLIIVVVLVMVVFLVVYVISYVVGGMVGWIYGFDYVDWVNSILVIFGFFDNDVFCKKLYCNCNFFIFFVIFYIN